jgi:predicted amidohydrolase
VIRIGCVQLAGDAAEVPEKRLGRVRELIGEVPLDLVLLPELWPVGFFQFERYEERAEPVDGPTSQAIAALARERGIHVHGGSIIERRPDGGLSNTSLLFSPSGELVLTYRKRHLFGYRSREAELLSPGVGADVLPTPLGRIGLTTCYDLRFPELYLELVGKGAELVLIASAWPHERLEHWRLLNRARALENLAFVVACNMTGTDAEVRLAGHSVMVDPWGEVVAEAGEEEGLLIAEIDVGRVAEVRASFPVLDERLRKARDAVRAGGDG